MCVISEKFSNPSILAFVLCAQKNSLQGDDIQHDMFSFVNKKPAFQLGKLEKLSHPSISFQQLGSQYLENIQEGC